MVSTQIIMKGTCYGIFCNSGDRDNYTIIPLLVTTSRELAESVVKRKNDQIYRLKEYHKSLNYNPHSGDWLSDIFDRYMFVRELGECFISEIKFKEK